MNRDAKGGGSRSTCPFHLHKPKGDIYKVPSDYTNNDPTPRGIAVLGKAHTPFSKELMHLPTAALLLEPNKVYPSVETPPVFIVSSPVHMPRTLTSSWILTPLVIFYHLKIFIMQHIFKTLDSHLQERKIYVF